MWAGTHYEPGITWWNQTPAFNTYLSRCSYLLQQGLFAADALIYQGDKSGYSHVIKTVCQLWVKVTITTIATPRCC